MRCSLSLIQCEAHALHNLPPSHACFRIEIIMTVNFDSVANDIFEKGQNLILVPTLRIGLGNWHESSFGALSDFRDAVQQSINITGQDTKTILWNCVSTLLLSEQIEPIIVMGSRYSIRGFHVDWPRHHLVVPTIFEFNFWPEFLNSSIIMMIILSNHSPTSRSQRQLLPLLYFTLILLRRHGQLLLYLQWW